MAKLEVTQEMIDAVMAMFGYPVIVNVGNAALTYVDGNVNVQKTQDGDWRIEPQDGDLRLVFRSTPRDGEVTIKKMYVVTFKGGEWTKAYYTFVRNNHDGFTFCNIWNYVYRDCWMLESHTYEVNADMID